MNAARTSFFSLILIHRQLLESISVSGVKQFSQGSVRAGGGEGITKTHLQLHIHAKIDKVEGSRGPNLPA